jgi:hypothetical protein
MASYSASQPSSAITRRVVAGDANARTLYNGSGQALLVVQAGAPGATFCWTTTEGAAGGALTSRAMTTGTYAKFTFTNCSQHPLRVTVMRIGAEKPIHETVLEPMVFESVDIVTDEGDLLMAVEATQELEGCGWGSGLYVPHNEGARFGAVDVAENHPEADTGIRESDWEWMSPGLRFQFSEWTEGEPTSRKRRNEDDEAAERRRQRLQGLWGGEAAASAFSEDQSQ